MARRPYLALLLTGLLVTPVISYAEGTYYDYGFVGGSIELGTSVFDSEDEASFSVEPNLFYNGQYGFIDGSLVNWSLLPWIGVTGQWRFAEVSDDINDLPDGIENRKGNGELGITLGTVGARLTYLHDISDEHDGYEVQLHLGRSFVVWENKFSLTPYMEIDYRDQKLSSHLYNVSNKEANLSSLNAFNADETWVYQAGLIGIYDFSPQWLAIIKTEFEHHDSNSPLIQNDIGWSVSVGFAYNFSDWL